MAMRKEFAGIKLEDGIVKAREGEKRKFSQTFDLIVNIRNIDLKKPENKFSKDVILPHGRGKDVSVCIISDIIPGATTKTDVEDFSRSKSAAKQFTKKHDFFVCEAPLMPLVGKILGRYLGPKGKMPRLLPPGKDPKSIVDETKKSIRINIRDTPTIQIAIGSEDMQDVQIKENAEKVLEEIKKSLPAKAQIRNVYVKTTMGKPVKIGVL
ncbi:MAG: 50S ribosomal protein L1 [Candidatus Aenigmarchaeota archaeon]|nr:50S ribosomal protein L1 [Candidatus Aenigmarchaeota archaeon]